METIFLNSKSSNTSEPHGFKLDLTYKLNPKNSNKNMALANFSIYYTWKNLKTSSQNTTTINLKLLHQLGMMLLIYLMVLILLRLSKLFKITENTYNVGAGEAGYNEDKVCKNEVVNPLKPLTTFWRALNIPLINCEIELILT